MREIVDGAVSEAGQHVCEVFADGYAEPAAALDDGEDGGDFWAGLLASQVDPVLAACRHRAFIMPLLLKY